MDILVSFNNTYQFPGYPILGVLDPDSMKIRIVELPPHIPQSGMLGLAISDKYVFTGLQYSYDGTTAYRKPQEIGLEYSAEHVLGSLHPCSLLVFDRSNFKFIRQYVFELVKDVHSFYLNEDANALLVVSTGTDEVIQIDLEGERVIKESVLWRPATADERTDNHHLNSIITWNGDILVSGFGQKEVADDWNTARNGFIYNISKNQFLVEGLSQPHSLAILDGKLAYCESKQKRVKYLDAKEGEGYDVGGYTRGLCAVDGNVFVGTSARRNKSKSTGKPVKNVEGVDIGCTITRFDQHGNGTTINLSTLANEIYELIPIDGTAAWPFKEEINYKLEFAKAWERQKLMALEEMRRHLIPDTPFVMIDDMQLGIEASEVNGAKQYPFIEKAGFDQGPPATDEEAIQAMLQLEKTNPRISIAFAWPAFWWMETYPGLAAHLQTNYDCVLSNERLKIYAR